MKTNTADRPLIPAATWLNPPAQEQHPLGAGYLLLITLLAAGLRFYALTGQSLWVDEVMSWAMIRPGAGLQFLEQIRDAIQGPLYLALTWPLVRLEDSAFMLRLVPAVAGTLTIPLFALTVQRLFGGRSARLAGLLLAVAPFHLWYSQEGRGYALLMFCAVAMGYLLLRMIDDGIDGKGALLFALASAGAVWSNMSGLFLWLAMGASVLVLTPPRSARQWLLWALAFGGGLAAVVPWVLKAAGIWAVERALPGNATGEALRGETTFTPLALPYTFYSFFYGYSLGPSLRELHQPDKLAVIRPALPLMAAAAVPVAAGLLAGLAALRRRSVGLVFWIAVPFLILVFLAVRNIKPWNPRYICVALPWILAVTVWGLAVLPRRLGGSLALLLVGLSLFSVGNHYWNGRYAKADVRAVTAYIQDARPDTPVLVTSVANVFRYYDRDRSETLTSQGFGPLASAGQADLFLDRVLGDRPAVLYLAAREWFFDPNNLLPEALARRGSLQLEHQAPGVTLYDWRAQPTGKGVDGH